MEAVGAAASILAIAGTGIQVSLKLIAFADQIGTAPQRIRDVGTDVSVTAGTLQELGELMRKNTASKRLTGIFKPDQVQHIEISSTKCKHIFDELKEILGKASQQLRDAYQSTSKSNDAFSKIRLSRLERMKWPFLQPSIQSLRSALGDAKATLTLILQVVHLRYAHVTASLDQEEQNDLIRMIAAMRRQQLAPTHGGGAGDKGLEASDSDTENSDSSGRAEVATVLEAWSVTPNTLPDSVPQHLLVTQIPVSQQQIEKILRTPPQDLHEISSIIDSLSSPERDIILGKVLRSNHSYPDDSTIRSISRESWTGSHVLFGKVTSRKFKLIIERRVEKPRSSRAHKNHMVGKVFSLRPEIVMHEAQNHLFNDHHSHGYASYSDSDEIHDTERDTRDPRILTLESREEGSDAVTSGDHINSRTAEQTSYKARKRTKMGCLTCRKRRIKCDEERPTCKNCIKSKRECEGYVPRVIFKDPLGTFRPTQQGIAARTQRPARETVQHPVETCKKSKRKTKPPRDIDPKQKQNIDGPITINKTKPHNAREDEENSAELLQKGYAPRRSWTEPQSAREISDDHLVRNLLAEYTNFKIDEPLVQNSVTPPPTYDEAFIAPKRIPRPY